MRRNTAGAPGGGKNTNSKTLAKLIAMIRNSRSGRSFLREYEYEKEASGGFAPSELTAMAVAACYYDAPIPLKALLEDGADPDAAPQRAEEGGTMMHSVCRRGGSVETLTALIDAGAGLFIKDSAGRCPIDYLTPGSGAYAVVSCAMSSLAQNIQAENMQDEGGSVSGFDYAL